MSDLYECQRTGKLAHPTRESAHRHRCGLAKDDPDGDRLDVYRCGRHWHVGHNPRGSAFDRRLRRVLA